MSLALLQVTLLLENVMYNDLDLAHDLRVCITCQKYTSESIAYKQCLPQQHVAIYPGLHVSQSRILLLLQNAYCVQASSQAMMALSDHYAANCTLAMQAT